MGLWVCASGLYQRALLVGRDKIASNECLYVCNKGTSKP